MAPTSTVIITGGNGSLGSTTALYLARNHPGRYHLHLTARSPDDSKARGISIELRATGQAFTWGALDLSSSRNVRDFAKEVTQKIREGHMPSLECLVNSAARASFKEGEVGEDAWDIVEQINVLSPFLLTILLLPLFEQRQGGKVINVSSGAISAGRLNYFGKEKPGGPTGLIQGLKEGLTRYGSSKLIMVVLGYELQRRLNVVCQNNTAIFHC